MNNFTSSKSNKSLRLSIASSILVGLGVAYSAYILFLQTAVVSRSRLAIGCALLIIFATANFFFTYYRLKRRLATTLFEQPYVISLCLLLPLIFLPLFYNAPAYPINPLLQPWMQVAVQFDINSNS